MNDRSIPYYNVIMRMDSPIPGRFTLPDGFTADGYREGDMRAWAEMEVQAGDFETPEAAEKCFAERYLAEPGLLADSMVMIRDPAGRGVSCCIAWHHLRKGAPVPSLEWLVTREGYEGRGLARATAALTVRRFAKRGVFPVYLHTQPWSYKAIWLYHEFGFRLALADTFHVYENQVRPALPVLEALMPKEKYERVVSYMITDAGL